MRQSLEVRAATMAELLPKKTILALTGSETDLDSPAYQELKSVMTRARQVDPDTRFIYVFGERASQVVFLVDSEVPSSEDYSAPGEVYDDASPELKHALQKKSAFTEGPLPDDYGTWISGLASVTDNNGKVIAVVGMDVAAARYQEILLTNMAIPLGVTFVLLLGLIAAYIWLRRRFAEQDLQAEIVSVASHDLRSPLNGILWAAQTAVSISDTAQMKKLLHAISMTAADLHMTVNTLLDLAIRKQTIDKGLELMPVDASELLKSAATLFTLSAQAKNITITTEVSPGLLVMADAERLRRAIANLVNNAVKYSHDSGTIKLAAYCKGKTVVVTVADNGIGIPAAEQAKIMQGYQRAANAGKVEGTGLGLVLVQRIITAHQGRLALESEAGKGTTWTMTLPVQR